MLQVPIKVLAETPDRKPIAEDAHTLVVNAHGGLLKLRMEVLAGQPLTLVDPKRGKREKAHVIRIEQPSPDYYAVAFEFERPSPDFWPIVFPPDNWGAKIS